MSDHPSGSKTSAQATPMSVGPFGAYCLISLICGIATVVVAIVTATIVNRWTTFSADCLFAMAAMVASPAILGVGISFFVSKTANSPSRGLDRLE